MSTAKVDSLSSLDLCFWREKIRIFCQLNKGVLGGSYLHIFMRFLDRLESEFSYRREEPPISVSIDEKGFITEGEDVLRRLFFFLSFDEMLYFIDEIFQKEMTDVQRSAVIDLAYEKVYNDERKASQS